MAQSEDRNRRVVLARRPTGVPEPDCFRLEEAPVPEPGAGEVLLRTQFLSIDPYMRGRMSDGPSYAEPVAVGAVMVGGTVSVVQRSKHPDFREGERVLAYAGWQDYALSDGSGLQRIDTGTAPASYALGVLGMPGFTGYAGLLEIGAPRPGETLVVAAASGAVGSVVGQIAKLKGCRVVGVAGGPAKCRHVVENLGFDACIDHHAEDFPARLAEAVPDGIDIYFENVGGAVLAAVLPLLNANARVPVCGLISQYNAEDLPPGPDRTPLLLRVLLTRRVRMQGFIIHLDFPHRHQDFLRDMRAWLAEGRIRYREDRTEGLEHAPETLLGVLQGRNFGKAVVHVAD